MCGRYTLRSVDTTARQYAAQVVLPFVARFNIAPTQTVPVLRNDGHGYEMAAMRWGLVPTWAKDLKIGSSLINARSETIATKPAFRKAFACRRCLIPADGFYEWQKRPTEPAGPKSPHFIHMRDDEPFVFAGLWERWGDVESCTIITTQPNELMSTLHDRMPVILTREGADVWTDPGTDLERAHKLLSPYPAELMDAYPISTRVNTPRNEGPDLIVPAT